MYYWTEYPSPVGLLTLAGKEEKLIGLWIEGQKYFPEIQSNTFERQDSLPLFLQTEEWLSRYFHGEKPSLSELPLSPEGSPFRQIVWKLLCEIPYGEVTTYGSLAKKAAAQLGKDSMSSQAVGGAVGHNPISIIIPCHRVVGSNGSLTGYAGGIETKIKLLRQEGVDLSPFFVPKKGSA